MKHFDKLTYKEKERAIKASLLWTVEGIVYGFMDVKLINPRNQQRLDHILKDAAEEPRLSTLRILINKPIIGELRKIALIHAEDSLYDKHGSRILKDNLQ